MEETKDIEFKTILDRTHPEHWMKTICAFSMCGGGKLMVGYADDGSFVGIPADKVDDEVQFAVNQFVRLSRPKVLYEVTYEENPCFPGKKGIIFEIKPRKGITWLTPHQQNPLIYIREEKATKPAGFEETLRLLLEASTIPYDSMSVGVGLKDVTFDELSALYASKHSGRALTNRDLLSFGLIDKDGFLTITGLLFADDSDYVNATVVCTTWPSEDKGGRSYTDTKSYSGSVLTLVDHMVDYVENVMHYTFGGRKSGMYREEIGSFSIASLREACVNAVAHRDYTIPGSISLQCFPDRIEITSPGSMRSMELKTNALLEGIESDRRNPTLCAMLSRCGLMEERGSGFDLILDDYRLLDERYAPRITSRRTYFTLVLKNKMYSFGSFIVDDQTQTPKVIVIPKDTCFAPRSELFIQNPKYRIIEDLVKRNPHTKYADIATETGLSLSGVKYIIGAMKEACLIRRQGSAANGHFEVVHDIDRPAAFRNLDYDEQTKAIKWCSQFFLRTQTYNGRHTSYGLKHTLQDYDGTYLTNGQFKGAMLICGYWPQNIEDLNWVYKISEKSPALNMKKQLPY